MMKSMDELHEEIRILKQNDIDTDELVRIADAIERDVEECYIEAPTDKNGEYIHIGDEMFQSDRITKRSCSAIMGSEYVMLVGIQGPVYAKGLTHYHEPTVEDVLEDYRVKYYDLVTDMERKNITNEEYVHGIKELASEFAAKLQLREED